jgi:hypothetical protein
MLMATRYRLVFRGKLLPGLTPEQVAPGLAQMFGATPEQVQALLASTGTVLKPDVDIDNGNRYLEAFLEAGLITHLEPATDASGTPLPTGWNGVERRTGEERRTQADRRGNNRDAAIRPDRRQQRGRRKTDLPE